MKFEEKVMILTESLIEALGASAKLHPKITDMDSRSNLQDRVEVMLEVASEILETQNRAAVSTTISEELVKVREQYESMPALLQLVDLSIPEVDAVSKQNKEIYAKLGEVLKTINQMSEAAQEKVESEPEPPASKEKLFKISFLLVSGLFMLFIALASSRFKNHDYYKSSHQKYSILRIQDTLGPYDLIDRAWRVDSIREQNIEWLNGQQEKKKYEAERREIDRKLERINNL